MKMKLENIHQSEYFMCKGSLEAVLRCTKKFLTSFVQRKKSYFEFSKEEPFLSDKVS